MRRKLKCFLKNLSIILSLLALDLRVAYSQTCPIKEYGDVYCVDYEGNKTDDADCLRYPEEVGKKPEPHAATCQKICITSQDNRNFRRIDVSRENLCDGQNC